MQQFICFGIKKGSVYFAIRGKSTAGAILPIKPINQPDWLN